MKTILLIVLVAALALASQRKIKNLIGRAKGYGYCQRCHDSWWWKKNTATPFEHSLGLFMLCDECWNKLHPREREKNFFSFSPITTEEQRQEVITKSFSNK
jgi:hypothetical protein